MDTFDDEKMGPARICFEFLENVTQEDGSEAQEWIRGVLWACPKCFGEQTDISLREWADTAENVQQTFGRAQLHPRSAGFRLAAVKTMP